MNGGRVIEDALRAAALPAPLRSSRSLGGGHGAAVELLTLEDGQRVVCKSSQTIDASVFVSEAIGLAAIEQTATVPVPHVIDQSSGLNGHVLLMTYVESRPASKLAWKQFGRDLAAMHQSSQGEQYGFQCDNYLGATAQPNGWTDDWVEFNRKHRLGHQLELARDRLLEPSETARIEALITNLDRYLSSHPKPALLHGDLWSGNALPTIDDRIAVIDPAVSIGDGLADISMMRLFGGFPQTCFDAYFEAVDASDNVPQRIAVYQLYHMLNHVNLFGRGYVSGAMNLLSALGH